LKIFNGTREQATIIATQDADQHLVDHISAYTGDPFLRSSMMFEVKYAAGDTHWITWSRDLDQTVQYENFVREHRELYPLLFTADQAKREVSALRSLPIKDVAPGDVVFVHLRYYGHAWYESLSLPDYVHTHYVEQWQYTGWSKLKGTTTIDAYCPIFDETWPNLTNDFVYMYGSNKHLGLNDVLVD
jgi:hypothetical protein